MFSSGKTKNSQTLSVILREFCRVFWGSEQLENGGKQHVPNVHLSDNEMFSVVAKLFSPGKHAVFSIECAYFRASSAFPV